MILMPASLSEAARDSSPISNRNPAAFSRITISKFSVLLKYCIILSATRSPTSSTSTSSSFVALAMASMVLKRRASFLAVTSPTKRMPSAYSTRSKGTPFDCSNPFKMLIVVFSLKLSVLIFPFSSSITFSNPNRRSYVKSYRSAAFDTRPWA